MPSDEQVQAQADELSLRIGRVVRAGVVLEHSVRKLFVMLVAPTPAMFVQPASVGSCLRQCRDMLKQALIPNAPEGWANAWDTALTAATTSTRDRNVVVHHLWLGEIDPDNPDVLVWQPHTVRPFLAPADDVARVRDAAVAAGHSLHRARYQVDAITTGYLHLQWNTPDVDMDETLAIMRGRFTELDGRGIEVIAS